MIEREPNFAVCSECNGQLKIVIWGEGIDSSIECKNCGKKERYR